MRLDPPLPHWLCAHQHSLPLPGFVFSSRLHLGWVFVLCGKSGLLDVRSRGLHRVGLPTKGLSTWRMAHCRTGSVQAKNQTQSQHFLLLLVREGYCLNGQ